MRDKQLFFYVRVTSVPLGRWVGQPLNVFLFNQEPGCWPDEVLQLRLLPDVLRKARIAQSDVLGMSRSFLTTFAFVALGTLWLNQSQDHSFLTEVPKVTVHRLQTGFS